MTTGDSEAVASDPFWSTVRRRHPDVDIVLLPPQPAGSLPDDLPPASDEAADRFDGELADLLRGIDVALPPVGSRWVPGPATGTVARDALVAAEDVDPARAAQALDDAERALVAAGWHVLRPADGMPRVLAGREDAPLRRELQVVHVPARGRLAVTFRCGPFAREDRP